MKKKKMEMIDGDLKLFSDMRARECRRFICPPPSSLITSAAASSSKCNYDDDGFSPSNHRRRSSSSDRLLPLDANKHDYDWLLTPPMTPLFPSLEAPVVNLWQRRVVNGTGSRLLLHTPLETSSQRSAVGSIRHAKPSATINSVRRRAESPSSARTSPAPKLRRCSPPTLSGRKASSPSPPQPPTAAAAEKAAIKKIRGHESWATTTAMATTARRNLAAQNAWSVSIDEDTTTATATQRNVGISSSSTETPPNNLRTTSMIHWRKPACPCTIQHQKSSIALSNLRSKSKPINSTNAESRHGGGGRHSSESAAAAKPRMNMGCPLQPRITTPAAAAKPPPPPTAAASSSPRNYSSVQQQQRRRRQPPPKFRPMLSSAPITSSLEPTPTLTLLQQQHPYSSSSSSSSASVFGTLQHCQASDYAANGRKEGGAAAGAGDMDDYIAVDAAPEQKRAKYEKQVEQLLQEKNRNEFPTLAPLMKQLEDCGYGDGKPEKNQQLHHSCSVTEDCGHAGNLELQEAQYCWPDCMDDSGEAGKPENRRRRRKQEDSISDECMTDDAQVIMTTAEITNAGGDEEQSSSSSKSHAHLCSTPAALLKRNVTLAEATDMILFCNSIVHELLHNAIAIATQNNNAAAAAAASSSSSSSSSSSASHNYTKKEFVTLFGFSAATSSEANQGGLRGGGGDVPNRRKRRKQPEASSEGTAMAAAAAAMEERRVVRKQVQAMRMMQGRSSMMTLMEQEKVGNMAVMEEGNRGYGYGRMMQKTAMAMEEENKAQCRCGCSVM